jgi:hypothetical protein
VFAADDVVDLVKVEGVVLVEKTVFALAAGSFGDQTADIIAD